MVGDSYADDIEGARALGMRAILLDREGLYPDEPDRIAGLGALPAALGLSSAASPAPSAARQAAVCAPSVCVIVARGRSTELGRGLGPRRNGPDADVLVVEELEPLGQRPRRERRLELARELVLGVGELPLGEVGSADQLAGAREELRLERAERQVPTVGGRVDPVTGERSREHPRSRLLVEPVADQPVAAMRHRDAQPGALTRAGAADECREHLRHRAEPAGREVCDLHRRPGRRVLEHAGPAEVVEVVTGPLGVAASRRRSRSSSSTRATAGRSSAPMPEARRDAGPEPFEHDVGPAAQSSVRTPRPSSGRR